MSAQSLWDSLPLRMPPFHSKNCTANSDDGRIHPGPCRHVVNTGSHSHSSGNPFLTAVRLALNECGLINECDTYDERLIAEYNNFDPERSLELLLERFSDGVRKSQKVVRNAVQSPTAFVDEMKTLVSWSNEGLKPEEVIQLEKNYGIQELGTNKNSLTYSRLRFLFPNFIGLTSDGVYGENKFIPQMFGAPEFGGLIPSVCSTRVCRDEIIAVHLCSLRLVFPQTSLKLHHLFLKKRIDGGLLSDEKRRHFLSGREIIKPDGKPTEKFRRVYATVCRLYSDLIAEIKQVEQMNGFTL